MLYDIVETENLNRFSEITDIIGEDYLPLPLFGVFRDHELVAMVAGEVSHDDWKSIIEENLEGAPIYFGDERGRAELRKIVKGKGDVAHLEGLLTEAHVEGQLKAFKSLIVPVTVAATIDTINPCAIGVLLVLLTFVFYGIKDKAVLSTGLVFSGAVYISYFLIGLGLIQAYTYVPYVKYAAIALAILLGVLRIMEFLSAERRHLPGAFVTQITKHLEKVSNPRTAFVAGVVTATLLLPCNSAPYFLALNLLSERATMFGGLVLLGIYNLIIIAPLIIITVCVHTLIVQTMELKLWMSGKKRWINLFTGLGLILLSLMFLFWNI